MRGTLRERRPGVWELRVHAGAGRYISRTVEGSRRDADRALARLVTEVDDRRVVATRKRTVATLADAWWEARAPSWSPKVAGDTRRWLDRQLLPHMGNTPLGKVGTEHVDRFYAARRRDGISEATIGRYHSMVRSMFAQGVRWGWLPVNPATNTYRPPVVTHTIRPPAPSVVASLLRHVGAHDPPMGVFLTVAADTGARLGQLCALRWADLDADAATVSFTRTVVSTGDIRPLSKTKGRARTVPVAGGTIRTLTAHRLAMRERALAFGARLARNAYLFSDDPDCRTPWKVDTFKHRYVRLRRQGDPAFAGLNFHQLRHYVATQLIAAGVDPRTVADRLGHSRTSTTVDMYAAPVAEVGRHAADLLEQILADADDG